MDLDSKLPDTLRRHQFKQAAEAPPLDGIQDLAWRTAGAIKTSYQQLHAIVDRQKVEIRRRWTKMSPSKRRDTLAAAWPGIPDSHRPASFDRDGANFSRRTDDLLANDWVFPFINQEDLKEPKALLMFINARGEHAPVTFATTETKFPLSLTMYDYAANERDTMDLSGMDNYGKIICFETREETFNFEERSCGLPPLTGLFVLRVQFHILGLLLRYSQSTLWSQDLDLLTSDAFPVVAEPASLYLQDESVTLFRIWVRFFDETIADKLITNPQLGDPSDGRFKYPVNRSRSLHKTVNEMCIAEANLDTFWRHVDFNVRKFADEEEIATFQRLFDGGGQLQRTTPWNERPRIEKPRPADLEYTKPLSIVFHDSSQEITGNFDKSTITEKIKPKTQGEAAPEAEVADDEAPVPGPEPQQVFRVDKNSYTVFRTLFHIEDEGAMPSKIKGDRFVGALTNFGFSAQALHGSAWLFTPSPDLGLSRDIQFHQPHPDTDIPYDIARQFGRRLKHAYGWDGSMFKKK